MKKYTGILLIMIMMLLTSCNLYRAGPLELKETVPMQVHAVKYNSEQYGLSGSTIENTYLYAGRTISNAEGKKAAISYLTIGSFQIKYIKPTKVIQHNIDILKKVDIQTLANSAVKQLSKNNQLSSKIKLSVSPLKKMKYELQPSIRYKYDLNNSTVSELFVILKVLLRKKGHNKEEMYGKDLDVIWKQFYTTRIMINNNHINSSRIKYKIQKALKKTIKYFQLDLDNKLKFDPSRESKFKLKKSLEFYYPLIGIPIFPKNKNDFIIKGKCLGQSFDCGIHIYNRNNIVMMKNKKK